MILHDATLCDTSIMIDPAVDVVNGAADGACDGAALVGSLTLTCGACTAGKMLAHLTRP